jgi:hypothetical protein
MSQSRGRRIMANMSAFQANDESSILSARTNLDVKLLRKLFASPEVRF